MSFRSTFNKLRFYTGFLLLAFYLTVGFIFLFTDVWGDLVPKGRALIGLLLILFGTIRFYVGYLRYNQRSMNIQEKTKDQHNAEE
jgi:cytochrome c biogenesis protein CcdA